MDAKVTAPFTDKDTGRIYLAGDAYSGSDERVGELMRKGHVEAGEPGSAGQDEVPSKEWRLDRLQEYAASLGLDAGSLRKKDDVLALITEAEPDEDSEEGAEQDSGQDPE